MFPTPVGMNRTTTNSVSNHLNVPHTRGDEPLQYQAMENPHECSPHPWG